MVLTALVLVFTHVLSSAEVALGAFNEQINYQGKLTDTSGAAVADGDYNMRFYLYDTEGAATTSAIWTEELTGTDQVTVTNGLFSVMLGSTTPLSGVDFNQTLYLGVEIGGTGAPAWDGEMSPRKILGAVPAAFEARQLDGLATTSFLRSDVDDTASGLLTFTGTTTHASSTFDLASTTKLRINGEDFTSFTGAGSGLTNNNGTLTANISESNLNITGGPTNGYILQASSTAGGGFVWQATSSLGVGDGTFLGLSDTISSYTAGSLLFTSASGVTEDNTNLFWDDSADRLGIGTSSPSVALDVNGVIQANDNIRITNSQGDVSSIVSRFGNLRVELDDTHGFQIQTSAGNTVFDVAVNASADALIVQGDGDVISNSGNVGIGTTSPSRKLTVAGDAYFGGDVTATGTFTAGTTTISEGQLLIQDGSASLPGLAFANDTNTGLYRITGGRLGLTLGGTQIADIRTAGFEILSNVSVSRFNQGVSVGSAYSNDTPPNNGLLVQGNVGIGTTSPGADLHVVDVNQTGTITDTPGSWVNAIFERAWSGSSVAAIAIQGSNKATDGAGIVALGNADDWDNVILRGGNDSFDVNFGSLAGQTKFTVQNNGNVGIGTTSPAAKLDVYGTANDTDFRVTRSGVANSFFSIKAPAGTLSSTKFGLHGTDRFEIANNGGVLIGSYVGGSTVPADGLIVSGNVGIGTSSPDERLHIHSGILKGTSGDDTGLRLLGEAEVGRNTVDGAAPLYLQGTINGTAVAGTQNLLTLSTSGISSQVGNVLIIQGDGDAYFRGDHTTVSDSDAVNSSTLYLEGHYDSDGSAGVTDTSRTIGIRNVVDYASASGEYRLGILDDNDTEFVTFEGDSGNVGIGTTTPSSKLTVAGDVDVTGTKIRLNGKDITGDGNNLDIAGRHVIAGFSVGVRGNRGDVLGMDSSVDSSSLGFFANSNEAVTIRSTGNVGIGTTSPASKLDVWGDFRVGTGSTPTLFTDVSTGQVGIGTSDPGYKLELAGGDVKFGDLVIDTDARGSNATAMFSNSAGNDITFGNSLIPASDGSIALGSNSRHFSDLFLYNGAAITQRQGQNQSLTINLGNTRDDGSGITDAFIVKGALNYTNTSYLSIQNASSTELFEVGPAGSGYFAGNVGMGTTSPASRLDVWGDLRVGTSSTPTLFTDVSTGRVGIGVENSNATLRVYEGSGNNGVRALEIGGLGSADREVWFTSNDGTYNGGFIGAPAIDSDSSSIFIDPTVKFLNGVTFSQGTFTQNSYTLGGGGASSGFTFDIGNGAGEGPFTVEFTGDEAFRVNTEGNVGVGVTSPSARLSVRSTTTSDILNLFETGGTEVFTVLENGNVGIGTTSPSRKLTVAGDIYAGGSLTVGDLISTTSISAPFFTATDASATSTFAGGLNVGSGGLVYNHDSGNVGVGMTTPSAKLDVFQNGSEQPALLLRNGDVQTLSNNKVQIALGYNGGDEYRQWITTGHSNSGSGNSINFYTNTSQSGTFPNDAVHGLSIRGGKVGIATTTPSNTLDVEGNMAIGSGYSGDFNAPTNGLIVEGNVGIGTTSPDSILHLEDNSAPPELTISSTFGSSYHAGALVLKSRSSNSTRALGTYYHDASGDFEWFAGKPHESIGSDQFVIGRLGSVTDHDLSTASVNNALLLIDNSGNVGIGTTDPQTPLDVQGTASSTRFYANDGSGGAPAYSFAGDTDTGLFRDTGTGNLRFALSGSQRVSISSTALTTAVGGGISLKLGSAGTVGAPSYSFETDEDTGMFRAGTNALGFSTAGSEHLRITSGGNVGIGTTSPASKLDVWGDLRVGTSSTPTLFTDVSTGRVGIGTEGPAGTLEIGSGQILIPSGSVGSPSIAFSNSSNTGIWSDSVNRVDVSADGVNSQRWYSTRTMFYQPVGFDSTGGTGDLFLTRDSANVLRISSGVDGTGSADLLVNGNVGIGTTSPSRTLTVAGTTHLGGDLTATGTVTFSALTDCDTIDTDSSGVLSCGTDGGGGGGLSTTTPWTVGDIVEVVDDGTVRSTSTLAASKIEDAFLFNTGDTVTGDLTFSGASIVIGGDTINEFAGTGLSVSGNALTADLGTSIDESELNITGGPTDGYVLQASSTSAGGFVWTATSSLGISSGASDFLSLTDTISSYNTDRILFTSGSAVVDSADFQFDDSTDTLTVGGLSLSDTLISHTGAATTTVVNNNPFAWTIATSTGGRPLFRIDTTVGAESVNIGDGAGDIFIGGVGQASDLVFEESSTISGQGENTITLGVSGDIFTIPAGVKLGIGTSSPGVPFSVETGIHLSSSTPTSTANTLYNQGGSLFFNGSAVGGLTTVNESDLNITGSPTDGYVLQASSTSAGGFVWQATSSLGINSSLFTDDGADTYLTATGDNILFGTSSNPGSAKFVLEQTGANDILNIFDSGTEVFTILDGGNVGIGTTSPQHKLTIDGTASSGLFIDGETDSGLTLIGNMVTHPVLGSIQSARIIAPINRSLAFEIDGNADADRFSFITGGDTESLVILNSGNVGIGTTSPASKLDVWGDLRVGTSSTPTLFTDVSTGRMGIGTENPSETLDVNGTSVFRNDVLFATGGTSDSPETQVEFTRTVGVTNNHFIKTSHSGTPALNKMVFAIQSEGNDVLTLQGNGNVGIGTTTPDEKLTVADGISIFDSTSSYDTLVKLHDSGDDGILDLYADNSVTTRFHGNGNSYFTGGNVGIGTEGPDTLLEIESATNGNQLSLHHTGTSGGNYAGLSFKVASDVGDSYRKGAILFERKTSYNDNILHFALDGTADSSNADLADSKLAILTNGNVGIGTTTPPARLTLQDSTDAEMLYLSGGGSRRPFITFDYGQSGGGASKWQFGHGIGTTNGFGLRDVEEGSLPIVFEDKAGDYSLYVTDNTPVGLGTVGSQVGIGTSTPIAKLNVVASNVGVPAALITGNSSSQSADILQLAKNPGASPGLIFTASGELAIGTTSPASKLDVWGDLRVGTSSTPTLFTDVSTGRVGIGTESPENLLQIGNGTDNTDNYLEIAASGSQSRGVLFTRAGNTDHSIYSDSSEDLRLNYRQSDLGTFEIYRGSGQTFVATFDENGNLGIGDTDPDARLEVSADGGGSDLLLLSSNDGQDGDRFIVKNDGSIGIGTTSPSALLHLSSTAAQDLFRVDDNGAGDGSPFVIDQSGRVGIGTASPSSPLYILRDSYIKIGDSSNDLSGSPEGIHFDRSVSDPDSGPGIRWTDGTLGGTIGFYIQGGINYQGDGPNDSFIVREPTGDGTLGDTVFEVVGNSGQMTVTGNVGIGTTSPSRTLTVAGTTHLGGDLTATGTVTFSALTDCDTIDTDSSGVLSCGTDGGGGGGLSTTTPWTVGDIVEVVDDGTVRSTSTLAASKIEDAFLFNTGDTVTGDLTFSGASLVIGGDTINEFAGNGLSVSGNALTADLGTEITVGELASADFGDFTCNGTTCSFDTDTVSDNEIDYTTVTLNDLTFDVGSVSKTEFGHLDGVTSAIQTQLDAKLEDITGESLEDLADVDTFTQNTNDVLYWTGTGWNVTATTSWDTNTQLSTEEVQDITGGMVSGNTETLISVTYQDGDGTLDFVVDNDLANYSNATANFFDTAGSGLTSSGSTVDVGAGTGITVNANDIEATLGTAIDESELNITGSPTDGYVLQASSTSAGGFVWQATSSLGITEHDAVTLAGEDYLSLSGQEITANPINLGTTNVTGTLGATNGGTGLNTVTENQLLIGGAGDTWTQVATSSLGLLGDVPDSLSPDNILSTGQTDEHCLTYEETGDTFEWQSCSGGSSTFLELTDTPAGYTDQAVFFSSGSEIFSEADFAFASSTNTLTVGGMTIADGLTAHTLGSTTTVPVNNPFAWTIATGTDAAPLFRIDTTGGGSVSVGSVGSDVFIGEVGSASDLIFEESSTISGQGGNTITLGVSGDIFTIPAGVKLGIGTSSPGVPFSVETGIHLSSSTPTSTANTLYNRGGSLFFNGSEVSGSVSALSDLTDADVTGHASGSIMISDGTTFFDRATSSLGITSEDLSDNSIEDLSDVSSMTKNTGDLFYWNGAAWADIATSALAIALSDTTGTLAATRGGTGLSTITENQLLIGGAGDTWTQTATSSLGLGDGTFLGLGDTISSYNANRILFESASGVTDSANFVFDGTNLGIGSTSPSLPSGFSFQDTALVIEDSTNPGLVLNDTGQANPYTITPGGDSLRFYYGDSTLTALLDLESSGDVGINIVDPDARLHVASDEDGSGEYNNAHLRLSGWADTNKRLNIGFDTTDNFGFLQAYESGVAARDLVLNPSGGNVGVGSTSPSRRLTVNGNIYGANLTATGTLTTVNLALGGDTFSDLTGAGLVLSGGALTASITPSELNSVDSPGDEECLTYESAGTTFEWQSCGSGSSLWSESGSDIYFDTGNVGIGTTSPSEKLTLHDGLALVTEGDPVKVGGYETGDSGVSDVAVVDDYAYIMKGPTTINFEILDISDPANPVGISGLNTQSGDAVAVSGNYAYLGVDTGGDGLMKVVDISDPETPVEVGSVPTPEAVKDIAIAGTYAYTVNGSSTGEVFEIFDISDPTNPVKVGGTNTSDGRHNHLVVSGTYVYAISELTNDEFIVYDVSDPTNPVKVGGAGTASIAYDIAVSGKYVYISSTNNNDDLEVFDVSDPTTPTKVGGIDFSGGTGNGMRSLAVVGDHAYVAGEDTDGDDFYVVDISSSTDPVLVGSVEVGDLVGGGVVVSGNYAYLGSGSTGDELEIFEISGIRAPSAEIGSLLADTVGARQSLWAGGSAFIDSGLNVGTDAHIGGALTITGTASSSLQSGNTRSALIVTSGYVGVGNTAPALDLHVGSTSVSDGTDVFRIEDTNSSCDYDANTGSGSCTSDETLKTDIEEIDNELLTVSKLAPVFYRWKTDSSTTTPNSGFIAQEVQKVLPELVGEQKWKDGTMKLTLNIGGMMPYVVGAIGEQQKTLDELLSTGTSTMSTTSPFYHLFDGEEDTVWEKLVRLAKGFVDGVLTVAGIRTDELCVGDTCVDEATFMEMVEAHQNGSASSGGSTGGSTNTNDTSGGGSTDTSTDDTPTHTDDGTATDDTSTTTDTATSTDDTSTTTDEDDTSTTTEETSTSTEDTTTDDTSTTTDNTSTDTEDDTTTDDASTTEESDETTTEETTDETDSTPNQSSEEDATGQATEAETTEEETDTTSDTTEETDTTVDGSETETNSTESGTEA